VVVGLDSMIRKKIVTNNKEIYSKLKMLDLTPEVVLNSIEKKSITKILNNINRDDKVLDIRHFGDITIVKKLRSINFDIYLKK
jgi:hypothetical protein